MSNRSSFWLCSRFCFSYTSHLIALHCSNQKFDEWSIKLLSLPIDFIFICDFEMITMNSLEQHTKCICLKVSKCIWQSKLYWNCFESWLKIQWRLHNKMRGDSTDLLFDARIQIYYLLRCWLRIVSIPHSTFWHKYQKVSIFFLLLWHCIRYKMPSQNGPQISYDALLMNHFEFKIMCNKQTVKLCDSIFRLNRCGFIRTIGVLTVTCLKLFSHINLWFKVIHKDGAPFRMALIAHTLNLDTNQSFGIW